MDIKGGVDPLRRIQPVMLGARRLFTLPSSVFFLFPPLIVSTPCCLLIRHYLRPFPFHIPLICTVLPPVLFLPFRCLYDPQNRVYKTAISFPSRCESWRSLAAKCLFVHEIAKNSPILLMSDIYCN